jgi:DNA-binding IclR family transcriptional regulator
MPTSENEAPEAGVSPKSGIQSLDQGLQVLLTLAAADGFLTLKEIGYRVGMSPSKVHRYLHSLVASSLCEQSKKSGKYGLGLGSLNLGFAAIQQLDLVNRTADDMETLVIEFKLPVLLSVWSNKGPVVVRFHHAATPAAMPYMLGSVLPLLGSTAGQVFLSYLHRHATADLLREEMASFAEPPTPTNIATTIDEVIANGYAIARGTSGAGMTEVSVPILNWQNVPSAVVTVLKPHRNGDTDADHIAARLLRFSRSLSVTPRGFAAKTK